MAVNSSRTQWIIGVVVLLLSAATVAQTAYFQGQLSRQRQCLTSYSADLNSALQERSATTGTEAAATKTLLLTVFQLMGRPQSEQQATEAEFNKAFQAYAADIATAAKTRADNPYPPFPEGKCE